MIKIKCTSKTCPFIKKGQCDNETVLSGKAPCYRMGSEVKISKIKKEKKKEGSKTMTNCKEAAKHYEDKAKKEAPKKKIKITQGTLTGEYDTYIVENGVVTLHGVNISSIQDVEEFRAKVLIEAEKRVNELMDVLGMVM